MSREQISVTVTLSLEIEGSIFDIRYNVPFDQDSWKEINDFVQQTFLQRNLNKFKSPRPARERQTGRAAEKSTEEKNTNANPKERKKGLENKRESKAKKQTKKEPTGKKKENKENPVIETVQEKEKDNGKPKAETNKAKKLPANRGKRNSSTLSAKKQEIATALNNSMEKVVSPKNTSITTNAIKIDPEVDCSMPYVNTSPNTNATASFRPSISKNKKSPTNNSLGKEAVIANNDIATRKGDACAKKNCEKEKNKKISEKCESRTATLGTINKLETLESNVASRETKSCEQTETSKCAKNGREKIATTENKKIGKFEQRLLEKQDRRAKRKLRNDEKKVERAMEELNHHVTRMVKQMNYLSDDNSKDHLDNDCCSDSSTESPYSDSCCSNSSCSCCTSCSGETSDYSEYTLGSSSD